MEPQNPFHYGTPVEGDQFVGRESEVGAVVGRIRDHINVVLLSPRRYGKTSILLRAERELRPLAPAIVHVNVLRCRDAASLASSLASGAFRVPQGRWHRARQVVPEFLRRLRLRPSVEFDDDGRPQFSFGAGLVDREVDLVVSDVFDLLSEEAERGPAALVLDEFQSVVDLDPSLPAVFKAMVDAHPDVSLVAAGSKQHLMERLFVERNAPLFNTTERIALGAIPDEEMIGFVCRRVVAAGKVMLPPTARLILETAGPVPDDIQHLAYEAFEAASGGEVGPDEVGAGLATAVGRLENLYIDIHELLTGGQRRVLRAIADDPTAMPSSSEFVRRTGLANASSVKKALDALIDSDLVAVRSGHRQVADPFLAAWLRGTVDGGRDF